jgi:hypothetical protein
MDSGEEAYRTRPSLGFGNQSNLHGSQLFRPFSDLFEGHHQQGEDAKRLIRKQLKMAWMEAIQPIAGSMAKGSRSITENVMI